jgi:Cof subfamily protein (haloacid dehalogenase superfamily)
MNKQIKMIVTDLDRSLLNNSKEISDYSVNILRKCTEQNIIITFATARPRRSTILYERQINPKAVIYLNGAIITVENEIIKRNGIENKVAKNVIGKIENEYPDATISVEMNDKMYTNFDFNSKLEYTRISLNDLPDFPADKIIIGTIPAERILEINKYLNKELYLEINDGIYGFILHKNASKWNGIKFLSKYYNINTDNIIAFGDDINDLSMIKNCGIGIAMKNGLNEIKEAADNVCEENENDGIAKWLEKNILQI